MTNVRGNPTELPVPSNEQCVHGCGRDALVELDNGTAVCGPCSLDANPDCPGCGSEAA